MMATGNKLAIWVSLIVIAFAVSVAIVLYDSQNNGELSEGIGTTPLMEDDPIGRPVNDFPWFDNNDESDVVIEGNTEEDDSIKTKIGTKKNVVKWTKVLSDEEIVTTSCTHDMISFLEQYSTVFEEINIYGQDDVEVPGEIDKDDFDICYDQIIKLRENQNYKKMDPQKPKGSHAWG